MTALRNAGQKHAARKRRTHYCAPCAELVRESHGARCPRLNPAVRTPQAQGRRLFAFASIAGAAWLWAALAIAHEAGAL